MYWSKLAEGISPYVPGEQPDRPMIKLNTNENPYPPSPRAVQAVLMAANSNLRLYPDPESKALRESIARAEGLKPENVFVGNGSDEVLALSFLAFCNPGDIPALRFADITYSFYPVYASLFKMEPAIVPLNDDFTLPVERFCDNACPALLCNPNAPTSLAIGNEDIRHILASNPDRPVIIDEAYAAFAEESAAGLIPEYENLLVIRTFSKSHSLAGLRVGYALGSAHMIEGLNRVKNSFNSYPLDRIAQAGAKAAAEDEAYTAEITAKIKSTRERSAAALRELGFDCPESSSNFLFVEHESKDAGEIMAALRERGILVRRFASHPRISNRLRITVGTDQEMDALLAALREIL